MFSSLLIQNSVWAYATRVTYCISILHFVSHSLMFPHPCIRLSKKANVTTGVSLGGISWPPLQTINAKPLPNGENESLKICSSTIKYFQVLQSYMKKDEQFTIFTSTQPNWYVLAFTPRFSFALINLRNCKHARSVSQDCAYAAYNFQKTAVPCHLVSLKKKQPSCTFRAILWRRSFWIVLS